jgi:hypothetical protein
MSEEFRDITNWAAVVGEWEFSNGRRVFKSPEDPQSPHGICVSSVRFSEGTAGATVRFSEVDPNGAEVASRLLFGYRSLAANYLGVGLGGGGRAYSIYQYTPQWGWHGVAFAGNRRNLVADHPYQVSVRVQGQRVLLEVDSVQVLEHVLETPLPQGQFGLFAWGTTNVEFTSTSVSEKPMAHGEKVFIGHGRSPVWRELKDFLESRLHLATDEFNRIPTAGIATPNRLEEMLGVAAFAFLIMTAEDEQPDGKLTARMNVIHEVGLFQGRLDFEKAIVLLEDGCEQFSNIHGLGQIRFQKGNISAKFEEIRQVLERENVVIAPP